MNRCGYCEGDVPVEFRRSLRVDRNGVPFKSKPNAKTFYHSGCVTWKKKEKERKEEATARRTTILGKLTTLLYSYEDSKASRRQAIEIVELFENNGVNI